MVQSPVQNTPQTTPAPSTSSGQAQGQPPPAQPSVPSTPSQPSQPSKTSVSSKPSQPSQPSQPSLPSFPKPKLPPLKLPLLLALVALIAVALGIFLAVDKRFFQKTQPSPSPSAEDHSKPPEENIFGVNGKIVSIDKEKKIFEVIPTIPNWNKRWLVKVGEDTILAAFSDYTKTTAAPLTGNKTFRDLAKSVPRKQFEDYRVGDNVYLMAAEGQDFPKEIGVFEPFAFLLQKSR